MKKFCIELFRAIAFSCVMVALLTFIRWLLLTETLAGQVIAALLVLGLLVATVAGAVIIIVGLVQRAFAPRTEYRCGQCTAAYDKDGRPLCPAAFTGVEYPCQHYKRNIKKRAAAGDPTAAHK